MQRLWWGGLWASIIKPCRRRWTVNIEYDIVHFNLAAVKRLKLKQLTFCPICCISSCGSPLGSNHTISRRIGYHNPFSISCSYSKVLVSSRGNLSLISVLFVLTHTHLQLTGEVDLSVSRYDRVLWCNFQIAVRMCALLLLVCPSCFPPFPHPRLAVWLQNGGNNAVKPEGWLCLKSGSYQQKAATDINWVCIPVILATAALAVTLQRAVGLSIRSAWLSFCHTVCLS